MAICYMESPVGRLALEAEGIALSCVRWADRGERARVTRLPPILKEAGASSGATSPAGSRPSTSASPPAAPISRSAYGRR